MARKLQSSKTTASKAYSRELSRIKRGIKRLEQRGYTFDKPPVKEVTRPTRLSVEKLQKITAKDLYKYAKYTTEEGKKISGEERRKQERQESAKKSAETRRRKKAWEEQQEKFKGCTAERYGEAITPETYKSAPEPKSEITPEEREQYQREQFEREQRIRDEEAKRRLKEEQSFREKFSEGKIVYEQIMDMIAEIDIQYQRSADSLRHALDREFDRYGEDKVLMAMAEADSDFLETCRRALTYLPEDERHIKAISHLHELITGVALTIEEAQRIHDEVDSDSYENEI